MEPEEFIHWIWEAKTDNPRCSIAGTPQVWRNLEARGYVVQTDVDGFLLYLEPPTNS